MSTVPAMRRLAPPVSEWKSQDMLQAPAGTASVISMNIRTMAQGPSKTRSTSETRRRLRLMFVQETPHSCPMTGRGRTTCGAYSGLFALLTIAVFPKKERVRLTASQNAANRTLLQVTRWLY